MRRILGPLTVAAVVAGGGVALAAHGTVTRQRAPAVAAAISLSYLPVPSSSTTDDLRHPITPDHIGAALGQCLGAGTNNRALAEVVSPTFIVFSPRYVMAASTVAIQPSQGQVANDLTAISSPKALGCLKRHASSAIRSSFTDPVCGGPTAALFSLTAVKIPSLVSGSDGTFAYRFRFVTGCKHGLTYLAYADYVGFAWGQAEVTLTVETNNQPPPGALERQLAALLFSHARRAIN